MADLKDMKDKHLNEEQLEDELEIVTGGGSVWSGAQGGAYRLDHIETRYDTLLFKKLFYNWCKK